MIEMSTKSGTKIFFNTSFNWRTAFVSGAALKLN
jgi:hypothetical protein